MKLSKIRFGIRTRMLRGAIGLMLAGVLACILPGATTATSMPPRSNSIYGMDILGVSWQWTFPRVDAWPRLAGPLRLDLLDSAMRQAAEAGVRFNRLAVWWCMVEPERDHWFWDDVDAAIQIARNYGIETVPELMFTPYWAVTGAPYAPECISNRAKNVAPSDMADWDDFVRTVVRRYGLQGNNAVRYWEIWNEPDLYEFWVVDNPSPARTAAAYATLLKHAAAIIHAESPGASVMIGGLSDINGATWLDLLLSLRGDQDVRQSFDVLAVHVYSQHQRRLTAFRSVLLAHGLGDRAIWDNELNYFGWDYAAAQAGLPRLLQDVLGAGIARTFWYVATTSNWGPGIFEPRDPTWDPLPFVPSPFFQTFKAQAAAFRVAFRPTPLEPATEIRKTTLIFTWEASTRGDYPITGYKLQVDNQEFMGAPRFARPELDAWVSTDIASFVPLVTTGHRSGQASQGNGRQTTVARPASAVIIYILPVSLAWGKHTWRVAAVDVQGNVGPYSELREFWLRAPHSTYLPLL